jgi:formate dehydrogenase accessory protein FdhD
MAEHAPHDARQPAPPADRQSLRATRFAIGGAIDSVECLAEEVPVAMVYNGISHAVMLASPAALEDFALGFSLAEGILAGPDELYDCETVVNGAGIELRMEIAARRFAELKGRRRSLAGRTGCGLCGVESLAAAVRPPAPLAHRQGQRIAAIHAAVRALECEQDLHRATRAAHAAAWVRPDGTIALMREDVGRHNALDKLIGARARLAERSADGFALVTSRASVEMVQKAASAGIGLLVALCAPTTLAVEQARQSQLTLVGRARANHLTCYSHEHWLQPD